MTDGDFVKINTLCNSANGTFVTLDHHFLQTHTPLALAAATHHSAQQNGALRSQKTATRASEEAGSETYYAPRGLKTLPPGTRPAPPSEVAGPQGAAATVGYVAAGALLLVVASLAGGDDVDATTVSYLLSVALAKEKEEEKEKEVKEKEAEEVKAREERKAKF